MPGDAEADRPREARADGGHEVALCGHAPAEGERVADEHHVDRRPVPEAGGIVEAHLVAHHPALHAGVVPGQRLDPGDAAERDDLAAPDVDPRSQAAVVVEPRHVRGREEGIDAFAVAAQIVREPRTASVHRRRYRPRARGAIAPGCR